MANDGNGHKANEQQQQLIKLLCRGLSRLAIAAQGVDRRLDQQLTDLRKLLRVEITDATELQQLVDAIDSRIKDVDDERGRHGDALQAALERIVTQLLALKPSREISSDLKVLQKKIRDVADDDGVVPFLLSFAALQSQVLNAQPAAPGLLSRWFGGKEEAATLIPDAIDTDRDTAPTAAATPRNAAAAIAPKSRAEPSPAAGTETSLQASGDARVEARIQGDASAPVPAHGAAADNEAPSAAGREAEAPFSRVSEAVCAVIHQLLRQIEPPPHAADNHQNILDRITGGLNWYELVPTLEDLSFVVLAALERDRGEFHQYLLQLNQRLATATQVLQASKNHQSERRSADATLNDTVRGNIEAMREKVAAAAHLDELKSEVTSRLESVVVAMDTHKVSEQQRQVAMEQYLTVLEQRIHDMEQQSVAMEQQMVEQRRLALVDLLTQLPNRSAYEERLEYEVERWVRYQRPLVLAICDIDHFKTINDNFGHLAGDKVLRILARTLRARLRKTDFIARFGGEEFVVLMPETNPQEALHALEMVREAVASCPFHFRDKPLKITMSAGIASFTQGDDATRVFERADLAMYRAKDAGRDRCELDARPA